MSTGKIELSVGAVKYVDPNEMITEEEYNYIRNKVPELNGRVGVIEEEIDSINNKVPELDERVGDIEDEINSINNEVEEINSSLDDIMNDKRNNFQLPQSNGVDDTSVIQEAINENIHINFCQGETYIINEPLICAENTFLHLNYSTLKAGDRFIGDSLIAFDNGVVGSAFTNAGVFNGILDGNCKCGGIKARGPVDRFNIDDLYITNINKPSIFIYSRYRVFGRENEGYYGDVSHYGAEGFNISKIKVIPNCDLGENPCLLIEDSNEFTIEDSKFFGHNGKGSLSLTNVNKYGGLITQRISTNVYMNPLLKNVAFAGFNSYGLKFYKYYYPNLISCTFEMLNNSIIFEETKGITFKDNRMLTPGEFDRPKIKLLKSGYFNVDISNHSFGEEKYRPIIDVADCSVGTIKCNNLAQIIETNSKDIIYEQINANGGKYLKGSNADGTYVDYSKALIDIDCGSNRTTPIILFHKEGVNALGVGADGNLMLRNGIKIFSGRNSPEGVIVAVPGSIYIRSNPSNANEVLYIKASGYNTNTGWVAK